LEHGAWPRWPEGAWGSHSAHPMGAILQWDPGGVVRPHPTCWMYSADEAEMLPKALYGHMEFRVNGNWDRNICWGGWQ